MNSSQPPIENKAAKELPEETGKSSLLRSRLFRWTRDLCGFAFIIAVIYFVSQYTRQSVQQETPEQKEDRLRAVAMEIREATDGGNHESAIALARELVNESPRDGRLWLLYADTLVAADEFEAAIEALRTLNSFRPYSGFANYRLAAVFCLQGDNDKALYHLELANANGYKQRRSVFKDESFEALLENERFIENATEIDQRDIYVIQSN